MRNGGAPGWEDCTLNVTVACLAASLGLTLAQRALPAGHGSLEPTAMRDWCAFWMLLRKCGNGPGIPPSSLRRAAAFSFSVGKQLGEGSGAMVA
jgi:hypothetical protein